MENESMGIHTYGLAVFPYFNQVIPETLNAKAEPELVKEKGATALIDGREGFFEQGSILFLGGLNYGHKGYGMSLWCEATAALRSI